MKYVLMHSSLFNFRFSHRHGLRTRNVHFGYACRWIPWCLPVLWTAITRILLNSISIIVFHHADSFWFFFYISHVCFRSVLMIVLLVYTCTCSFVTALFPSADDDVITSPYNTVLALRHLTEHADCVLPIENQVCSLLASWISWRFLVLTFFQYAKYI